MIEIIVTVCNLMAFEMVASKMGTVCTSLNSFLFLIYVGFKVCIEVQIYVYNPTTIFDQVSLRNLYLDQRILVALNTLLA